MKNSPTALIADDEPLLRQALVSLLAQAWPELQIVAQARNGREALEQFEQQHPDICFLDIHMPGLNGIDAAKGIGRRAHVVFVTAYDQYAVQAFQEGALDYLVKPVEPARLADTVQRLQARLQSSLNETQRSAQALDDTDVLLRKLAEKLGQAQQPQQPQYLRWIRATVRQSLYMIPVEDVDFLRSDEKYTLVAWHDQDNKPVEALIRASLKELLAQLDPSVFAQVHRSIVVNLKAVSHVQRHNETASIYLKHRRDVLKASRNYLQVFAQM